MALTDEEIAEKIQAGIPEEEILKLLSEPEAQSAPEAKPQSNLQAFMSGFHPVDAAINAGKGLYNLASQVGEDPRSSNPLLVPGVIAEQLYQGTNGMAEKAERTAELISGAVPGFKTIEDLTFDVLHGQPKTQQEYFKQLGEEYSFLPTQAALTVGGKVLGTIGANRAARVAARTNVATPEGQAALRYATNAGLMDNPVTQQAINSGKYEHPYVQEGLRQAYDQVKVAGDVPRDISQIEAGATTGGDALISDAFKQPRSSGATSARVNPENLNPHAQDIYATNIFNTSDTAPFNPYTGKFEGQPGMVSSGARLIDKANSAVVATIPARRAMVQDLSQAMNAINKESPGAPKIRGITFTNDLAPNLDELRTLIDKRKEYYGPTNPMAEGMQKAINDAESSFSRIQNKIQSARYDKIGPGGSLEFGEINPDQALNMIEDMNAYRRSLGEFDNRAKANGLAGNVNDFAGRAAELQGLGNVQRALQSALEGKIQEIVDGSQSLQNYYAFSDRIPLYTKDTLPSMNKVISSYQELTEVASDHLNTLRRSLVADEQGRLITTQNEKIPTTKAGILQRGMDYFKGRIVPDPTQFNRAAALREYDAPISRVLDGLLMREKPVTLLSRSWEKVRADKAARAEVSNRAIAIGLLPASVNLSTLPEPMQSQIHTQVIQAFPEGAEQVEGNYDITNQKFNNIFEQEAHMRMGLERPLEDQARVLSAAYEGKFAPIDNTKPQAVSIKPEINIGRLNNDLYQPQSSQAPDYSYDNSNTAMLEELTKSRIIHDTDIQ